MPAQGTRKSYVLTDLSLVDTIVFLMMENRSFDHMLGHLSLSGSMPRVDGLHAPLEQDQACFGCSTY